MLPTVNLPTPSATPHRSLRNRASFGRSIERPDESVGSPSLFSRLFRLSAMNFHERDVLAPVSLLPYSVGVKHVMKESD